tara:strand:- start:5898 stop:6260 length:363 start_codon:yes stop_codon:yes gene_type:complete
MATISRNKLSGSTDGRPLALAVDSGTFTTVHTVTSVAADFEEVWIWLSNINTTQEIVTIRIGGTSDGDKIIVKVPAESTVLAVPGWTIKGNNSTAVVITAASTTANKVNATGYINLIDAA